MSKSFLKTILLTIFIAINNFAFAQNDLKAHVEFDKAETAFQDRNYQTALKHITENEKLLGVYSGKVSFLKIQVLEELADFRRLDDTYLADLIKEVDKYMNYSNKNPSKVPIEKLTTVYDLEQRIEENRAALEQERIAKEQRLAEEERQREEAEAKSYTDAMSGNVSAIRRFLKDYPNHHGKSSVLDLFAIKEEEAYKNAIEKADIYGYEHYLRNFYDGQHKQLITTELNKAKELKAYEQVLREKSVIECESYLHTYTNGANKAEVLTVYEQVLNTEAQQAMLAKDYTKAKGLYEKYKIQFPNGSSIKTVETNYNEAQRKMKKAEVLANREDVPYFMVNYALNASIGLEFGKLNNSYKPSVYGGMYYGFKRSMEKYGLVYEGDGDVENLKVSFVSWNFGLTLKIIHPLWAYAGGAFRWGIVPSDFYYVDDDFDFYPEFGLKTLIEKKVVLKAGTQILKNENVYQFGVGIKM